MGRLLRRALAWGCVLTLSSALNFELPSTMTVGVHEINSPEQLKDVIKADVASLVLFTDGSEETPASKFFQEFSAFAWRGPRVIFATCDMRPLRQAERQSELLPPEGAEGIYLFAKKDADMPLRLPRSLVTNDEASAALEWIEGALAGIGATPVDGKWHKARDSGKDGPAAKIGKQEL